MTDGGRLIRPHLGRRPVLLAVLAMVGDAPTASHFSPWRRALRIWARGLGTQLREVESGFRLTNLDNERPTWLDRAHARLDQIARRRRAPARPGAGRAPLARPWKVTL